MATRTHDYYVDHEHTSSMSLIGNDLIPYELSQDYIVEKQWADNGNQDGARPESLTAYLIQKNWDDRSVVYKEIPGELNEENGWRFQWKNYPAFSKDGTAYYYEVREDVLTGYTAEEPVYERSSENAERGWERTVFTNTHAQAKQALAVSKQWLGETNPEDKLLRPDSITFDLYCRYTTYTREFYNEDDMQTALTTDEQIQAAIDAKKLTIVYKDAGQYDGPVSEAAALREAHQELKTYETQKNLRFGEGEDPAVDDQWNGKITFSNLPVYLNACGDDRWNGKGFDDSTYSPTARSGTRGAHGVGGGKSAEPVARIGETEYVFLRVTVPCDVQTVERDDGSLLGTDPTFSAQQTVYDTWRLVGGAPAYNEEKKQLVYVYAYANSAGLAQIREGETTPPLFDRLLLWNFNEAYDSEGSHGVQVEALAIRADLPEYTAADISGIWQLLSGEVSG